MVSNVHLSHPNLWGEWVCRPTQSLNGLHFSMLSSAMRPGRERYAAGVPSSVSRCAARRLRPSLRPRGCHRKKEGAAKQAKTRRTLVLTVAQVLSEVVTDHLF